ncbi:MAG TPA: hypothetical protein PL193_00135 [Xanthobacteraceae bacterium]|nr:hypothetical protein [Xanthobacteraceae bacterium]
MTVQANGFLVVLSDVKTAHDRDYLAWLTTEHVQERLGIPGFLGVRIFSRPIEGGRQYFIWYQLANADIVDSPAYVERLNNPTPWSQRIMPILGNFGRAGGKVKARKGDAAVFMMVAGLQNVPATPEHLDALAAAPGIRSLHLFETDLKKTAVQTNERALRSSDHTFSGLLLLESDDQDALTMTKFANRLDGMAVASSDGIHIYQQVFGLQA